jgi:hypothetical protein
MSAQLDTLKRHQAWRRGEGDGGAMLHPAIIGEAIDYAIAIIEAHECLEQQRDELLAALSEYITAADNSMNPTDNDDVAAMLRFGEADKAARAAIAKAKS